MTFQCCCSTKEGTAGTPAYMPPELLAGKPFSKAVDVYMFGVLLWEMFARDVPFRGYAIDDIQRKELIRQCWSADPSHRPTFDVIAQKLRQVDVTAVVHAVDNIIEEDALDSLLMGGKKNNGRR
ncbi:hypothetical protein DYB37_002147 [Aphanomyces astaci]|uniref:Protein kinase domain-containing protein n=1 Tax=Aphanomyces astaci TaxID=112090 RepID=A0A3R7B382_APHAT|nr:hypothetical protein DYB35_007900 [Aphanomyces astaci]RHZ26281.1 hypothetical protein DYB37_002147 [Aphanomyces astaci]